MLFFKYIFYFISLLHYQYYSSIVLLLHVIFYIFYFILLLDYQYYFFIILINKQPCWIWSEFRAGSGNVQSGSSRLEIRPGSTSVGLIPSYGYRCFSYQSVPSNNLNWQSTGAGFALSDASKASGLSVWLGRRLTHLEVLPPFAIMLIICIMTATITEVASNTATANILLPILAEMVNVEIIPHFSSSSHQIQ